MRIIVDTNRIIAALIKHGLSRNILLSANLELHTIDYVLEEVKKYLDYVGIKSNLNKDEVKTILALAMENIAIVPSEKIRLKIGKAREIMREIDISDSPIIACALSIKNDGIWTEDKHFEKQNLIKVWKTKDLLAYV